MAMKQVVLTAEGKAALENELENLKVNTRKEVAEKIKVALGYGDLSENSEYDEAKNEQAIVEARISEIEQTLKNAVVLDESAVDTDTVTLGSSVRIRHVKLGKEDTYKIVGSTEAAPLKKRISDESPVGNRVGDIVDVEAPAGIIQYEILEIGK